jgi:hypothetical protein
LAIKAFIFGKDTAAFDEVDEATDFNKMKKAQELWRKRGLIGKYHMMVSTFSFTVLCDLI